MESNTCKSKLFRILISLILLIIPFLSNPLKVFASITMDEFSVPTANIRPLGITYGPGGNLWFTEGQSADKIGMITTKGNFSEFPIPTKNSYLYGITSGSDGNVWFTE